MATAAAIGGSAILGAISSRNASKRAAKAQTKAIDSSQQFTREATNQARGDIKELFPQAQQSLQTGFQGALDVFNQAVPQQANVFTQGNANAQQAIASSLPQIQNALFGNQVDFSQLQPQQLQQPDFSFLNQQLGQQQPEQLPPQNVNQGGINNLGGINLLGGNFDFNQLGAFKDRLSGLNKFSNGLFNNELRIP